MHVMRCGIGCNCYPRPWRANPKFCTGNLDFGNSTRYRFFKIFLFLALFYIKTFLWVAINHFCVLSSLDSISDLCSSCIVNSIGFDFAFWTTLWADKHSGLLGNLFFNGFTYGNIVSLVGEYFILLGFYVSLPDEVIYILSSVWACETFLMPPCRF